MRATRARLRIIDFGIRTRALPPRCEDERDAAVPRGDLPGLGSRNSAGPWVRRCVDVQVQAALHNNNNRSFEESLYMTIPNPMSVV